MSEIETEPTLDDELDALAQEMDEAPEPVEAEPVESEAPDAPEPASDPTEPAPVVEAAPEPPIEPFSVKVYGQAHAIPGVTYDPNQKVFKVADESAFHRMQNLLTKGREYETRGRQEMYALKRQLEQVQQEKPAQVVQAESYLEQWQKMMELPDDQLGQFLADARSAWPRMQAQAERAVADQTLAEARRLQEPPEMDPDTLLEQASDGAAQFVAQQVRGKDWADAETVRELQRVMQSPQVLAQFVYRAPQDVPQYGIRRGQWVADWDAAAQVLAPYLSPYERAYQKVQTVQAQMTATAPVAQQNARVLAKAGAVSGTAPAKRPASPPPPARDAMKALDDELDAEWRETVRAR